MCNKYAEKCMTCKVYTKRTLLAQYPISSKNVKNVQLLCSFIVKIHRKKRSDDINMKTSEEEGEYSGPTCPTFA